VQDLTVAIEAGIEIQGEIKLDDSAAAVKANLQLIQPEFIAQDGMPRTLAPTAVLARRPYVHSDGTFQIPRAAQGRYRLSVQLAGLGRSLYVSAARFGTQDVLGQVFEVTPDNTGSLVIELSASGASMEGTVTDKGGKPVPAGMVLLVPAINLRGDQNAYRAVMANDQGRFSISPIRPGTYTAFAFPQRIDTAAFTNPEVMAPYLNFAVSIDLPRGQTIRRDLIVLRIQQ
jgi:hypothetical protein